MICNFSPRSSRIHSLPNAYPRRTCAPHSSRPKFIASPRLSFPCLSLPPGHPFHHDRRPRLLPRPYGAFYRPFNRAARYTNSKFVHSIPPLVFYPLSSFSLPQVCLLRSLVGIIPRQGNYRYPELHNATPTHVYNRRHTPANISRY